LNSSSSNSFYGYDEDWCGRNYLPCYSINYGINQLNKENNHIIYIFDNSIFNSAISISSINITSYSENIICEIKINNNIEENENNRYITLNNITLNKLFFSLSSSTISPSDSSLIVSEGENTNINHINHCYFIFENSNSLNLIISYSLLKIKSGSISISDCEISSDSNNEHLYPIILIEKGFKIYFLFYLFYFLIYFILFIYYLFFNFIKKEI
jgi:PIN domain nuclease of toxin-antitoxin system